MNKKYARIVLALIGLLGMGATAEAQTQRAIVVTLPFDFVVDGKTFSAGTYTVSRVGDDKHDGLLLRSRQGGTSVFVHPIEVADASGQKPQVSFEHAGEQHFLSSIQVADDVYVIPVSRRALMEAAARSDENTPASESSGGK